MLPILMIPLIHRYSNSIRNIKDLISIKQDKGQDNDLEECVCQNWSPHERSNDVLLSGIWHSFKELIAGRLCCEGKGCEGVHDEVDPEELNCSQRRLLQDNGANESHEKGNHVDSKLENQELSNTVKDVTTVLHSSNNGTEVVVKQDYARSLFSDLMSSNSHCKADICFFEGRSVISTITSYCYDCV